MITIIIIIIKRNLKTKKINNNNNIIIRGEGGSSTEVWMMYLMELGMTETEEKSPKEFGSMSLAWR